MSDLKYEPVAHNHEELLKRARKKKGFSEEYDRLEEEYALARQLIAARAAAGLTQEQVAESMGTTKSAVSRLEAARKHSPSLATIERFARAVGCTMEIRITPVAGVKRRTNGKAKKTA